jgi:lysophospholipase L1-like esterase
MKSPRRLSSVLCLLSSALCLSAQEPGKSLVAIAGEQFDFAARQYAGMLKRLEGTAELPRTFEHGRLVTVKPQDWTSGFFPGALWLLHEQTGDARWKAAALDFTRRLEPVQHQRDTHDLGFMLFCSYGQGWRLTQDPAYRDVLVTGARSLASRFNPKVGLIKSWDWNPAWPYAVIIDNMMNLELLMFAHAQTGEALFRDIAVTHANTTLQRFFRPDGSSVHVVHHDPATGAVTGRQTHQGISDDSAWARGQAWGLYGFTVMHRLTDEVSYLVKAREIAGFLINHPRLPADKVPYWDLDDPGIPNVPRDASAAAIMASALIELSGMVGAEEGRGYLAFAEQQLRSLASPAYRAGLDENGNFLLLHCTGNMPRKSEIDTPLNYGDYYFLEALARWKTRFGGAARPAADPAATLLNPALPTIFIAGDSTAAKNNGRPIQGWGVPFADYFDPARVNIANHARGGRSSRTFITEGLWDRMIGQVKSGDTVLIQFGHNDGGAINGEPPGSNRPLRARGSLPGLGEETEEIDNLVTKRHEVVHTFGWYVRKMIADVKAKGATPIVLSLTVRNHWTDGKIERGSGSFRAWDRALAQAAGIEFVDLTRIVADQYQALGPDKVKELFAPDRTHMNPAGADSQAAAVVAGLKGIRRGGFTDLLSPKGAAVSADRLGWLNLPEPADPRLPSLVLIGDSTVRNGRGDGANGQWGWGDSLGRHFDPARINLVNRAVGGLSSRTFLTSGHWERALMLVKPGDFVVMQFGHNDNGPLNDTSRARGTIKGAGEETEEIDNLLTKQHEVVHSYGWYLRRFIRDTKAAGATPIVCSLVPRKTWQDGKISRQTDTHAGWAREVAAQEGVGFIDLNDLIATRYEALGAEKVDALFADPHTHTSQAGADLNAVVVAEALRVLPGAPLAAMLSEQDRKTK